MKDKNTTVQVEERPESKKAFKLAYERLALLMVRYEKANAYKRIAYKVFAVDGKTVMGIAQYVSPYRDITQCLVEVDIVSLRVLCEEVSSYDQ